MPETIEPLESTLHIEKPRTKPVAHKRPVSERQRLANSRNGKLGGPKTPAGRASVRLRAVKHGLTAKTTVMPYESPDEFRRFRQGFLDVWQPADYDEIFAFDRMVHEAWRLKRRDAVENATFSKCIEAEQASYGLPRDCSKASNDLLAATLYDLPPQQFVNHFRYGREIYREYYRARA